MKINFNPRAFQRKLFANRHPVISKNISKKVVDKQYYMPYSIAIRTILLISNIGAVGRPSQQQKERSGVA
jgi:hypothetical protein